MFQQISNNNNISENHSESIYNLVAKCDRESRPPRYVSRFTCKVRQDAYCQKIGCAQTMGCPKSYLEPPKFYLRKFSRNFPCFWKQQPNSKFCSRPNPEKCPCEDCNCDYYDYYDNSPPAGSFCLKLKTSQSDENSFLRKRKMQRSSNDIKCLNKRCHDSKSAGFIVNNVRPTAKNSYGSNCNGHGHGIANVNIASCSKSNDQCKLSSILKNSTSTFPQPSMSTTMNQNSYEVYNNENDKCYNIPDECINNEMINSIGSDIYTFNNHQNNYAERIPAGYTGPITLIDRGKKDYVRDNALAVIRCPPKIPQTWIVDNNRGNKASWRPKNMLLKKNFGRVPCYIKARKQELCQEALEMKIAIERSNKCKPISDENRCLILQGLQLYWDQLYNEYNRLPLFSSSQKILKLKGKLETQLRDVEKDLQLFKRNGPLYVDISAPKSHYGCVK